MTAPRDSDHCTCLGHLGRRDKDRNDPNCQGKEGRQYGNAISLAFLHTNLANVNEPLIMEPYLLKVFGVVLLSLFCKQPQISNFNKH